MISNKERKDLIDNPFISVIIPAINTKNWPNVINNLQSKKIKIEIELATALVLTFYSIKMLKI